MGKINVNEALKKKYIIPCFQREYSWEKNEIEELIDDIINNRNNDYCIGIVTVRTDNDEILLIDGQQRITTLYLIAIACNKIKNADDIMLISEYEKLVNKENNLANLVKHNYENIPKRLSDAYNFIKAKLDEKLNQEQNKWDVFKNIYYYEIDLDKNVDINHYFEVMNSRGVQLSRSDMVKSILMQHLSDNADKNKLNNLWYVYEKMNDDNNKYKSFSSFKEEKYKTINEILTNYKEDNANNSKKDTNNEVEDKSILNFDYFLLYVIRLYKKIDIEEDKNSGEFNLDDLTKEYQDYFSNKDSEEVLKFLNFMVDMKNIYDKYIVKYDDVKEDWHLKVKNEDMKLIQSCLRVSFTNRKLMHWLYLTLKYFYDDNNKDKIKKYNKTMRSYIKNEYIEKFIDDAKEKEYKTGFNTPNIVLNYLDFLIKKNSSDISKSIPEAKGLEYKNFKFKFRNSIEHFEPRHGENENQEWLDDFGNLALLAYNTNTEIQNATPKDKANHFKEKLSEYSLKLQIMAKITLAKEWNKENVEKVRDIMINLLQDDLKKL